MDTAPAPGDWPLSAAASVVLRDRRTGTTEVLRLALRELVARGGLLLREVERSRRWRGPARVPVLSLGREVTGPAPLPLLRAALVPVLAPGPRPVHDAVAAVVGGSRLAEGLVAACRAELAARGLVTPTGRRLGRRWEPTATGRLWAQLAARDGRALAGALPAVGLLLALDREVARALRRAEGAAGVAVDGGDAVVLDDLLGDLGRSLDVSTDTGASDGGGDGSGGGGD